MNPIDFPSWFETGAAPQPDGNTRVVRIPRGLTSKHRLFAIFVRELQFPAYFGWNWDALEECLCDLSWLPNTTVIILHHDLPFHPASRDRANYLEILEHAHDNSNHLRCWIAE